MAAEEPTIARADIGTLVNARRQTAGYLPNVMGGFRAAYLDGRPWFTIVEADRIRRDPTVSFGLRVLCSPLSRVTWTIEAGNSQIGQFVDTTHRAIWDNASSPVANSTFTYGTAAGEVSYRKSGRQVVFDRLDTVHPGDARPLEMRVGENSGKWIGVRVRGSRAAGCESGQFDLITPHAFWFAGEAEYGSFYGRPRAAGAHEPYLEKRGKGGAIDSRRLWFKKCAFRGGEMRHPMGKTEYVLSDGSTTIIDNEDLARHIVERYENGGVLTLPNARDEKGEFIWLFTPPGSNGEVGGILQYPKDLDDEIYLGLGIPPELVRAAETGSGYSGRAVPAQVFYTGIDEFAQRLSNCFNDQIIKAIVAANFGKNAVSAYKIKLNSLAKMLEEQDKPEQPGMNQGGFGQNEDGMNMPEAPQARSRNPFHRMAPQASSNGVQLSFEAIRDLDRKFNRVVSLIGERAISLDFDESRVKRDGGKFARVAGAKGSGKEPVSGDVDRTKNATAVKPKAVPKPAPEASVEELRTLQRSVPAEDQGSWAKIKSTFETVRAVVFNKVTETGMIALGVMPDIIDTADDYQNLKATIYGDIDAWKQTTGISWGFTMTLVKHAIAAGFKVAGHKAEKPATDLAMDGASTMDAITEVLAAAFEAVNEALGVDMEVDRGLIASLVSHRMRGKLGDATTAEAVEPSEPEATA